VPIEPDTKDWTWVLQEPCPECGFDTAAVQPGDLASMTRANVPAWQTALADLDAAVRPADNVWSPLEYACHVRDVHRIFAGRVGRMLAEDDPMFANWDQDVTAVEERYGEQDPAVVSEELAEAAEAAAQTYQRVRGEQWDRPGRRSNGSRFTVASLGRYHLHDVLHHTHDIAPQTRPDEQ
jgi:DinB superfamily